MKQMLYFLLLLTGSASQSYAQNAPIQSAKYTTTREVTYLKSLPDQKENLIRFITTNWFAMDSVAVSQGLMSGYKLWEAANGEEWNVVVAVAYPTTSGYDGIKDAFEKIRSQHVTQPIAGRN